MGISRNARAAVAYLIVSTILVVYDMAGMLTHPKWGTHMPALLMKAMPFLAYAVVPLIFILVGYAIAGTLNRERYGTVGVLLLGCLAIVWNIMPAVWRLEAGFPYAAVTCAWQMVLGVLIIYNASKVLQERGADAVAPALAQRNQAVPEGRS